MVCLLRNRIKKQISPLTGQEQVLCACPQGLVVQMFREISYYSYKKALLDVHTLASGLLRTFICPSAPFELWRVMGYCSERPWAMTRREKARGWGRRNERSGKQSHSALTSLRSFIQLSTESRLVVLISCNQNKVCQSGFRGCTDKPKDFCPFCGALLSLPPPPGPSTFTGAPSSPLFCSSLSLSVPYLMKADAW